MGRMNTGTSIVLAVAIGAGATWLWTSRGVEPAARHTSYHQSVALVKPSPPEVPSSSRSQPDRHSGESSGLPNVAPSVDAIPGVRDDSTYDRMLAFAQSDPRSASTARDIIEKRERFVFSPDDPDWGRRTEQALRDFFRAKTAGGGPQITSISCRSAGCEVQALSQPFCGGTPCELQAPSERRAAPDNVDPVGPLRGDWPGGLLLRRLALIIQPVGDRAGIIVTYSREARKPEATSP